MLQKLKAWLNAAVEAIGRHAPKQAENIAKGLRDAGRQLRKRRNNHNKHDDKHDDEPK